MVKTATNNNTSAAGPVRRRGGVNNAAKRAAAQQYKFANKTLNRSVVANTNAGQSAVATAGSEKQTSTVYTRKWLEENDKEKVAFPDDVLAGTFGTENVSKLVAACKLATETEVAESNRLLSDDYVYSVQITSHRAPHIPMHLSRILLPHSLETAESDICIFVKDLKRGRKLDHEPTVKHYEQLLRSKKVDRNITIIPINQLYNEFATFELRRKLTYLYDRFLVDKAVAAHVNGFLGHKLLSKGRSAIPVDLAADNLAEELEGALRKVFYKHINNGITQNVQVGRHSMADAHVAANVAELVAQLAVIHPGGTKNVYKLHLKPNVNVSVAVPLYVDLAKPTLETPAEAGPRAQTLDAAADNATATLENFDINKAGEVVAKPKLAKQLAAAAAAAAAAGGETADDEDADETQDGDVDMEESAAVVAVVQAASTPAPKPKPAAKVTAAAKKAANAAAAPVATPIAEEQLNNLILKNLKKLVPKLQQNQQQQQNTGRVQKNQGGGGHQSNNQQPQQQLQQQQQPKQQRQINNQQQQQQLPQQQQQQQRQNNQGGGQRQNNNNQQQLGGYVQQLQHQVPQLQSQRQNNQGGNRRNNNNQGGNLQGGNLLGNNLVGGGVGGGYQNNMGGGNVGGYQNQQRGGGGNLGGGLNNYGQQNQRNMGAIAGGNRGGFNSNAGGAQGFVGNNLGGGGNWGNAGGNNNSPWNTRNQF